MENKRSFPNQVLLGLLIAGFIGLLLITVAGGLWLHSITKTPPTITILLPKGRPLIPSGQLLQIYAQSRAEAGIDRIVFRVDGQEIPDKTFYPSDKSELLTVFPWQAGSSGIHRIELIAYDRRGRASQPAELLVGVFTLDPYSENLDRTTIEIPQPMGGLPPGENEVPPGDGSGGEPPVDAMIPAGVPPLEFAQLDGDLLEQVQQVVDNADGDQDFPQDIPGIPADIPPNITASTRLDMMPDGVAFTVDILVIDDIGVANTYTNIFKALGDPLAGFPFIIPSDQDPSFSVNMGYTFTEPGNYVFETYAVDTAGQHSEVLFFPVQVLESDLEGGPAVVVGEQQEAGPQDCGFAVIDPLLRAELPDDLVDAICDPAGSNQPQVLAEDDGCLQIYPQQTPLGINVDLLALCPFRAQSGEQVFFEYQRSIVGADQPLPDPLIHYPPVESFDAGQWVSYLERSPACWSEYEFKGGISLLPQGTPDDGIFNPNQSQAQANLMTQPCNQPDHEGPIEFYVDDIESGYEIGWRILNQEGLLNGHDVSDLQLRLERYKLETRQTQTLVDDLVPGDEIDILVGWWLDDTLFCGEPVYYRLQLNHQASGDLLFDQTLLAPQKECLDGGVRDIQFHITQEYFVWGNQPATLVQGMEITIPPGWSYPQDANLLLFRMPTGLGAFPITEDTRRNGKHYQMGIGNVMACGTEAQPFSLQVASGSVAGLGQFFSEQDAPQFNVIDQGRTIMAMPLFCMPPAPANLQLNATMCDGSPCIQLTWTPPSYADGRRHYMPDNLVLLKQTFTENLQAQDEISLSVGQVAYTDTAVFPDTDMVYKLYYEFGGVHSSETTLTIHTPSGDDWNCSVSSLEEQSCE